MGACLRGSGHWTSYIGDTSGMEAARGQAGKQMRRCTHLRLRPTSQIRSEASRVSVTLGNTCTIICRSQRGPTHVKHRPSLCRRVVPVSAAASRRSTSRRAASRLSVLRGVTSGEEGDEWCGAAHRDSPEKQRRSARLEPGGEVRRWSAEADRLCAGEAVGCS